MSLTAELVIEFACATAEDLLLDPTVFLKKEAKKRVQIKEFNGYVTKLQ